ncbi:MAG: DEAD/DEAH box helicase [Ignavibacteria bacterium]|nr:DEAD/DEAH box helicase [Ignavibacteria bacterium]
MIITQEIIQDVADAETIERGRKYFHSGKVSLLRLNRTLARANVQGWEAYVVEVRMEGESVSTSCTCPLGTEAVCEHAVASLLAIMYRQADVSYRPDRASYFDISDEPGEWRAPGSTPEWMRQVLQITPEKVESHQNSRAQGPWRLVYSILIAKEQRVVSPVRVRLRPDGADGTASLLKQFDLYDGLHFDITDRTIVPKIVGGLRNYVPEGQPSTVAREEEPSVEWYANDHLWHDILTLLRGKEVYLEQGNQLLHRRLTVHGEAIRHRLKVIERGNDLTIVPEFDWNGTPLPLSTQIRPLTHSPLWVLVRDGIAPVEGLTGDELIALQQASFPIQVPSKDHEEFLRQTLPVLLSRYPVKTEIPSLTTIDETPVARLYLQEIDGELAVVLRFRYGDAEITSMPHGENGHVATEVLADGDRVRHVIRKPHDEEHLRTMLLSTSLRPRVGTESMEEMYRPVIHPLDWLTQRLPALQSKGFEVFGQNTLRNHRLRVAKPQLGFAVSSGIDWFDLSVDLQFEGTRASFPSFLQSVQNNERFVKLEDGSYGVLSDGWVRKFRRMIMLSEAGDVNLRLSRFHVGVIDDLLDEGEYADSDERYREMRDRFRSFTSITPHELPRGFHGTLRPYQKAGFDWLLFLKEHRFGGILADDMGLGKTVQTLALLQRLYEDGETLPTLVVVPTSIIFNWEKEAARFTPSLRVLAYRGPSRVKFRQLFGSYNLIITSYGVLRRDIEHLRRQPFLYVVLDESQNIKNLISINARSVRVLRTEHRLALTGTPVENNLMELWSQFAFLNHGLLGNERAFAENYARPIEREGDTSAVDSLKKLVYPFILRRTKELVADDLPPKQESTVMCEMEPSQRTAYHHWLEYYRTEILKSIDSVGFQRSKIKVLEGLTKLRQVCCHPAMVDTEYKGSSGKFEAFTSMLEDILAEGHKVLVFSQFVKMLTILRRYCENHSISHEYLDGRTVNREERVERFQLNDDVKLFLISLKAGGTGLNLTAADYVIHYDPWWNPAVEMQATDRTHRIGQTRHVFSYKLITKESVEEKILALQEKKRHLVTGIITTDSGFMKSLTKEDIESLFSAS